MKSITINESAAVNGGIVGTGQTICTTILVGMPFPPVGGSPADLDMWSRLHRFGF